MRAPKRRRPLVRQFAEGLDREALAGLARRVRYVGSCEHKDTPSFLGQPGPRKDASVCPRRLADDLPTVSGWLRKAIRNGQVSAYREGDFPRYAWYRDGEDVYEARLTNRGNGAYKGYPLNREEWPEELQDRG